MAGLAMVFDVIARDRATGPLKNISKGFHDTGKSVDDAAGKGSKFGDMTHKGMKLAAAGLATAGGAAVVFGKQSVDAFTSNTKAAMSMQRAIGGSIEDASRLNFAARESGVSQEAFAKSIKLLEKNTVSFNGKAPAAADALKRLGINAKDSHGNMRPMADLLPDLADRFAKMPNGAEKSALALKLFGKGGLEMLPMLNRGKDGIKGLMEESDKFGLTVGDKNVKDMKANIVQQRQWHAMMDGLKVQIGAQLLPVITAFTGSVRDKLGPAIHGATQFLMDNKDTIANLTAILIRFLPQIVIGIGLFKTITSMTRLFTAAQLLLNIALTANPIGLVIVAIAALAAGLKYAWDHSETFRKVTTAAFQAIQDAASWMWNHVIAPVIRFLINGFSAVTDWVAGLFDALSHVPGFGWAKDLADKMHGAAGKAQELAGKIKDIPERHNTNITADTTKADKEMQAFYKKWTGKTLQIKANTYADVGNYRGGGSGGGGGGFVFRPVPFPIGTGFNGYPGHKGLDLLAPYGTPVRAGMSGRVASTGYQAGGFGYHVRTIDTDGNMTIYGHLSRIVAHVGQIVQRGMTLLGISGSSGRSSGPHLHLERRHPPFGINNAWNFISQLRGYAFGGSSIQAGWALVGERGPELAWMPQGSAVLPEDRTRGVMGRVVPEPGRNALVTMSPEALAALEAAVAAGAASGARVGAADGTRDGSYVGTRDGAAEGLQRAAEGLRRGNRAMTGSRT